jgi:5-formyltetrahydrofolate cyclo-ligase
MKKQDIRIQARAVRTALSGEQAIARSAALKNLLFSRIPLHRYSVIHAFLPILKNREPDTFPILSTLERDFGAELYVSRSLPEGELLHYPYQSSASYPLNAWGIPEPTGPDGLSSAAFFQQHAQEDILVLVPLLAFDKHGHRIGYGKGYYDRFLQHATPKTLKMGLSLLEAVDEITDPGTLDIPLDFCITPTRVWKWD